MCSSPIATKRNVTGFHRVALTFRISNGLTKHLPPVKHRPSSKKYAYLPIWMCSQMSSLNIEQNKNRFKTVSVLLKCSKNKTFVFRFVRILCHTTFQISKPSPTPWKHSLVCIKRHVGRPLESDVWHTIEWLTNRLTVPNSCTANVWVQIGLLRLVKWNADVHCRAQTKANYQWKTLWFAHISHSATILFCGNTTYRWLNLFEANQ